MRCCQRLLWCSLVLLVVGAGCTTARTSHTTRTGMEQLLISNAVDQALDQVQFAVLRGRAVHVQEKYLDCTDESYVIGSVRQRVLDAGGRLVDKPEDSDVVLELRSGGVGTDSVESFVGTPGIALPGPMPLEVPEVRVWNRRSQTAMAKLAVAAYDAKSREAIPLQGNSLALSDDNNWYVFGIGPFQDGSVRRELHQATGRGSLQAEVARYIPLPGGLDDDTEPTPTPSPEPQMYAQPAPGQATGPFMQSANGPGPENFQPRVYPQQGSSPRPGPYGQRNVPHGDFGNQTAQEGRAEPANYAEPPTQPQFAPRVRMDLREPAQY